MNITPHLNVSIRDTAAQLSNSNLKSTIDNGLYIHQNLILKFSPDPERLYSFKLWEHHTGYLHEYLMIMLREYSSRYPKSFSSRDLDAFFEYGNQGDSRRPKWMDGMEGYKIIQSHKSYIMNGDPNDLYYPQWIEQGDFVYSVKIPPKVIRFVL